MKSFLIVTLDFAKGYLMENNFTHFFYVDVLFKIKVKCETKETDAFVVSFNKHYVQSC